MVLPKFDIFLLFAGEISRKDVEIVGTILLGHAHGDCTTTGNRLPSFYFEEKYYFPVACSLVNSGYDFKRI